MAICGCVCVYEREELKNEGNEKSEEREWMNSFIMAECLGIPWREVEDFLTNMDVTRYTRGFFLFRTSGATFSIPIHMT
jgi:hypothetical protein